MAKVTMNSGQLDYNSEEAYKSLRTNLQFCGESKKVIAFTSCTPNEGKSSVTVNLAISLAQSGKRVIVIDTDLRKSVMLGKHRVEGEVKGLTHYLSNQAERKDILCSTDNENLYMIFAGPVPPNPAELLGEKKFETLVADMRKEFDYVLIDTPPLGLVIDSAIIARVCDGIVMVIESGAISYKFALEVKEQLEKSKCPILGAILNKADITRQAYYGKYGHYGNYKKED